MTPQELQVLSVVETFPRGTMFFVEDIEDALPLTMSSVRFILSELALKGAIVRPARGLYCYPRLQEGTMKAIMPTPTEVAYKVAERYNVRIVPSGDEAAFLSGLTTVRTSPDTWYTSGSQQVINLQNGATVRFLERTSDKVFRFRSEPFRNLVEGLKALGRESVGDRELAVAEKIMKGIPAEDLRHDIRLSPGWVRELLWGYLPVRGGGGVPER